MTITTPARILLLRIPDWSVHAHVRAASLDPLPPTTLPLAVSTRQIITASSPTARLQGIMHGMREAEALLIAPDLMLLRHDPGAETAQFEPVLTEIGELVPQVSAVRPGVAAMRARGPARFYGGESAAAERLLDALRELGFDLSRAGVADGVFAAEQAARSSADAAGVETPAPGVRILAPGTADAFLAPLPVDRALRETPQLATTLHGLGIHTLGALAALPAAAVRDRFGPAGLSAHARATGRDPEREPAPTHIPAPMREVSSSADPPLANAEQLAFTCSAIVETLINRLLEEGLVLTGARISLTDDLGIHHEQEWAHPRHFSAADLLTRLRWQSERMPRDSERTGAGIVHVRIAPTRMERAAVHEPALWSTDTSDRVHHQVDRVQQLLGPEQVGTSRLSGGRLLAERQRFIPWGTSTRSAPGASAAVSSADASGPWPGALPPPHPTIVYAPPAPVRLTGSDSVEVRVTPDEQLQPVPERFAPPSAGAAADPVTAWSRPWPLRERWWEGRPVRYRLQLTLGNGDAWLLLYSAGSWYAEGRYD